MRPGTPLFRSRGPPLASSLLQEYGPSQATYVLGFALHHGSSGAAHIATLVPAVRPVGTAAPPPTSYRSTTGFTVPIQRVVSTRAFSLGRALAADAPGDSNSSAGLAPAGASGGVFDRSTAQRASTTSSSTNSTSIDSWSIDVGGFTCKGYMASGGKIENQDRSIVVTPFIQPGHLLLGVLDGHGTFGHLVSSFLSRHLPAVLHRRLDAAAGPGRQSGDSTSGADPLDDVPLSAAPPTTPSKRSSGSSNGPLMVRPAERGVWAPFSAAFADADRLLCGSGIDVLESGSTAVLCHLDLPAGRLVTAWCGDSRAVLATRRGGGDVKWRVMPLSDDHKPERPDEKVRILLNGGRVEQMTDGMGRRGGPHRVWFRHMQYPGLAMSRAFGDIPIRRLGVSPEPEVTVVELGSGWAAQGQTKSNRRQQRRGGSGGDDELMLLIASDGVWEYMGNEEAIDIISREKDATSAAQALVAAATTRWRGIDPGYIDDITAVCLRMTRDS